ncbi:MAG: hypothetical protein AB7I30_11500 [Isosphaeraceae bacterium]
MSQWSGEPAAESGVEARSEGIVSRIVHGLLWLGGVGVVLLMAYTVALEVGLGDRAPVALGSASFDVAVIYPDPGLWNEFRRGVEVCRDRGLVELTVENGDVLIVQTPVHRRSIRFRFEEARGLRETREETLRIAGRSPPSIAMIGSSNTVLTVAIAEALGSLRPGSVPASPVLLIPWASAVLVPAELPGEAPTPLLKLAPDRSFRFCLNNQYQADLAVGGLREWERGRTPRRALIVEDRDDPFSVDLAGCFQRAVEAVAPDAEIVQRSISPGVFPPRLSTGLPGPTEDVLAASICREADASGDAEATTWVFLPLQDEPTRRFLLALQRESRRGTSIRVVCGDTIGEEALSEFAGRAPFPIFCVSSTSPSHVVPDASTDALIPAEIIATLAHCLDVPATTKVDADVLRESIAHLALSAESPAALGRSLAFRKSGERDGDDLGRVLMVVPERAEVLATSRGPGGQWSPPSAIRVQARMTSP